MNTVTQNNIKHDDKHKQIKRKLAEIVGQTEDQLLSIHIVRLSPSKMTLYPLRGFGRF